MLKILKFFSKTCVPCKMANPIIKQAVHDDTNFELVEIDIEEEENRSIVEKYGVMKSPTLVFLDAYDNEAKRAIGLTEIREIFKDGA